MSKLAELARLDAMAQAELRARGEVSEAELVEACLERMDALNPLLRAAVSIAREPARARPGKPLSGVPFLAKDSLPWPGQRWSLGSRAFARQMASRHMPYGKRLEDAGLVCVGKTAMSELGLLASAESLLEGVTHNPWDLSCSPAGSSGGSAAAVAAGLVPFAHASDGGGSIRAPAAVCGVFGFKPSRHRTSPATLSRTDFAVMTSDHCISRSVRDSALWLSLTEEGNDAVGFVRAPVRRRLRIATWTRTLVGDEPAPDVRRAHEDALALLASLGHDVVDIGAPSIDGESLADACYVIAGAAIASVLETLDRSRGVPVQEHELEPFTIALVEDVRARGLGALDVARARLARAAQAYRVTTSGYDVVCTPTLSRPPFRLGYLSPLHGREELLRRTAGVLGYTPIHNIVGCPAMSVPLSSGELPLGTHFAAAEGADALLLGLAYQLEEARPWRDRWPPYSIPRLFG